MIEVIATHGARGITHRLIDAHLGFAEGVTSYYYPRRTALLDAGFTRLFENGIAEFNLCYKPVLERLEAGEPIDIDTMAVCAFRHGELLVQPSRRNSTIARLEFYLLATRDPELRAAQLRLRRVHFDLTAEIFANLGCRNPKRASAELAIRSRGDYVTFFLAPSFEEHPRNVAYYTALIRHIIDVSNLAADTGA
ncbi:MAG: hypothetical protein JNJ73_09620 [Hyphomonadaceae bacterium]|nr:hypothetical protein [Hyphomonadaceae bacterium]